MARAKTRKTATGALRTLRTFIKQCGVARDETPSSDPGKKRKRKKKRRDPEPRRHARPAKKGRRRAKRRDPEVVGDPAWYGQPKRHATASRKGWRKGHHMTKTGRTLRRRDPASAPGGDPAWYRQPKRHAKAAKKGLRRKGLSPKAWGKKMQAAKAAKKRSGRDPARYRRSRLGRRTSAVSPWYMARDPE